MSARRDNRGLSRGPPRRRDGTAPSANAAIAPPRSGAGPLVWAVRSVRGLALTHHERRRVTGYHRPGDDREVRRGVRPGAERRGEARPPRVAPLRGSARRGARLVLRVSPARAVPLRRR